MRDDLKQGLTAAAGVMLVMTALTLWRRHEWNGPKESAEGKVVSCSSKWDSDDGTVYTTEYAFKDAIGADWRMTTQGIKY